MATITADDLDNYIRIRRKDLERYAEDEWGIERADDLKRYPNRASLAQAIMRRMAAIPAEDDETFTPKIYWAAGPPERTLAPQLKHPRLGIGQSIKPQKNGRYVAETPFQAQLIEEHLVARGLAFPEDPPEVLAALPREERGCEVCNFYPGSLRAAARHQRACHPADS